LNVWTSMNTSLGGPDSITSWSPWSSSSCGGSSTRARQACGQAGGQWRGRRRGCGALGRLHARQQPRRVFVPQHAFVAVAPRPCSPPPCSPQSLAAPRAWTACGSAPQPAVVSIDRGVCNRRRARVCVCMPAARAAAVRACRPAAPPPLAGGLGQAARASALTSLTRSARDMAACASLSTAVTAPCTSADAAATARLRVMTSRGTPGRYLATMRTGTLRRRRWW
jgi:hypothetical protein